MEDFIHKCYILKETDDSYIVEIDCQLCGKFHKHGVSKSDVDKISHRVGHCDNSCDYKIVLDSIEVNRWKDKNNYL